MSVSSNKTYVYKHPDWAKDSGWEFIAEPSRIEDEEAAGLTSRTEVVNLDEALEAKQKGDDMEPVIARNMKIVNIMSADRAVLLSRSVRWFGSEFLVPMDYTHKVKDPTTGEERDEAHPLCGQLMKLDAYWVGKQEQFDDVLRAMSKVWSKRRTKKEEATFQGEPRGVDQPPNKRDGKKQARVSADPS